MSEESLKGEPVSGLVRVGRSKYDLFGGPSRSDPAGGCIRNGQVVPYGAGRSS